MAHSSAHKSFPQSKAVTKYPSINLIASNAMTITPETIILVFANSTLLTAPHTANIAPTTKATFLAANVFQASSNGLPKNVSPFHSMIPIAILFKNMVALFIVCSVSMEKLSTPIILDAIPLVLLTIALFVNKAIIDNVGLVLKDFSSPQIRNVSNVPLTTAYLAKKLSSVSNA